MDLFNEGLLLSLLIMTFATLKIKASVKKKKQDKKFVKLQGEAFALFLLEYKESEAYNLKPANATGEEWYYVVNTVYKEAPPFANPFYS